MIDFVYSDPHFGHKNIIQFCERPFEDVDGMTEGLIERYRNRVGSGDTVLWLGDCFFVGTKRAKDIMSALPGRKILVRGNHDDKSRKMVDLGFDFVVPRMVFRQGGFRFRASHFPYADINPQDKRFLDRRPQREHGVILLHGHTHQSEVWNLNAVHCGVDAWDYTPASMGDIIRGIEKGLVWAPR